MMGTSVMGASARASARGSMRLRPLKTGTAHELFCLASHLCLGCFLPLLLIPPHPPPVLPKSLRESDLCSARFEPCWRVGIAGGFAESMECWLDGAHSTQNFCKDGCVLRHSFTFFTQHLAREEGGTGQSFRELTHAARLMPRDLHSCYATWGIMAV
jgi:hypothetical protein